MKIGDRVRCVCPEWATVHNETGSIVKRDHDEWIVDLDNGDCGWPMMDSELELLPADPGSDYNRIATEIAELVKSKQKVYGDSFGKSGNVLRELYPNGIKPEQYDDLLTIARILDKLFRVATDKGALGESPWRDTAGYALLAAVRDAK